MEYKIKKASLEDLEGTAALFDLYRIFYRQNRMWTKVKLFSKSAFLIDRSKQ